jgi:di/tricarboxylate transporter
MKKGMFLFLSFFFLAAHAQKSTDPLLDTRLQDYLSFTRQLNFDKAMDYMHPRLFAIVPKDQLIQSMVQAFSNEEIKITFDSMAIASVSPIYKHLKASYRKVDYYMAMTIALGDSIMLKSFQTSFPGKKIVVDAENNAIRVAGKELMFAIRDPEAANWMFLGYDRSNPALLARLYPKAVRQYFKIL